MHRNKLGNKGDEAVCINTIVTQLVSKCIKKTKKKPWI